MGLIDRRDAVLVLVDVQEKLQPHIHGAEELVRRIGILLEGGRLLGLPLIVTEQYPLGLGPTLASLKPHLAHAAAVIEKTSFSCAGAPAFLDTLRATGCHQVLVLGIEAHVCVAQTAFALLESGHEVFLAFDAVSSRREENKRYALERLARAGATISDVEGLLLELLRDSRAEEFRDISRLIR